MKRQALVAGNWKMNGSRDFVATLIRELIVGLQPLQNVEVAVCPSYVFLLQVAAELANTEIRLGAQNVCDQAQGAFTGEIAASMLLESGCDYVIVGHSERRHIYGESNELVAKRFIAAQQGGLTPILCVGETLAEREQGITEQIVYQQLNAVIATAGIASLQQAVVAYEPVWAIGTGKTATTEQAQEVHAFIRQKLAAQDPAIAAGLRILYGGSVKADNAAGLFSQPDIDGGLIGGASLKAAEFIEICRQAV